MLDLNLKPVLTTLVALVLTIAFGNHDAAAKDRVVALKDGGRLELHSDGTMVHYDAAGDSLSMKDGEIMIAADGSAILMEGRSAWREIVDRTARDYAHAFVLPWIEGSTGERSIDLNDGGRVEVRGDGTMVHLDRAGNMVQMKDGAVMTTSDGARIMMKNGKLWGAMMKSAPSLPESR